MVTVISKDCNTSIVFFQKLVDFIHWNFKINNIFGFQRRAFIFWKLWKLFILSITTSGTNSHGFSNSAVRKCKRFIKTFYYLLFRRRFSYLFETVMCDGCLSIAVLIGIVLAFFKVSFSNSTFSVPFHRFIPLLLYTHEWWDRSILLGRNVLLSILVALIVEETICGYRSRLVLIWVVPLQLIVNLFSKNIKPF